MEIGIYDQEIIYAICTDPATNGNIVSCPLGSLKPIGQFLPKCIPMWKHTGSMDKDFITCYWLIIPQHIQNILYMEKFNPSIEFGTIKLLHGRMMILNIKTLFKSNIYISFTNIRTSCTYTDFLLFWWECVI